MKNMNLVWHQAPSIIQMVYDSIPESAKNSILAEKKNSLSKNGKSVRMQHYIPNEVYVALAYFDAFLGSESHFFTALACEYIERRAFQLGMINSMKPHNGTK